MFLTELRGFIYLGVRLPLPWVYIIFSGQTDFETILKAEYQRQKKNGKGVYATHNKHSFKKRRKLLVDLDGTYAVGSWEAALLSQRALFIGRKGEGGTSPCQDTALCIWPRAFRSPYSEGHKVESAASYIPLKNTRGSEALNSPQQNLKHTQNLSISKCETSHFKYKMDTLCPLIL